MRQSSARLRGKVECGKDLRCRRLSPGVDENGEDIRQPDRRTEFVANAPHDSGLGRKTSKDIGARGPSGSAHSRIVSRQSGLVRKQPQSGRCIGGTSTKSGRRRQPFDEPKVTKPKPRYPRGERLRGAQYEVLVNRPCFAGARTDDLETQAVAGLKRQPVAQAGKRHETLELVISIRPATNHAQREINLGPSAKPSH